MNILPTLHFRVIIYSIQKLLTELVGAGKYQVFSLRRKQVFLHGHSQVVYLMYCSITVTFGGNFPCSNAPCSLLNPIHGNSQY